MFKFENNLPKYLINTSRDFQLMSRLTDSISLGQRSDISTITNLNVPDKCKNSILDLLAKKVGFFTDKYIDDNVLRHIIGAFQTAVKYKGTKIGISQAVIAILKAENSIERPEIDIVQEDLADPDNSYQIRIFTPIKLINKVALEEFLKYVVPIGWTYTIQTYQKAAEPYQTIMYGMDEVEILKTKNSVASIIRDNLSEFVPDNINCIENEILGAVDAGIISQFDDDTILDNGHIVVDPTKLVDHVESQHDLIKEGHLEEVVKNE